MRYPTKYTAAQKAAIVRLVLDDGYTARAAVAEAAKGVYTLAPFTMPPGTCGDLVWREKQRRAAEERAYLIEHDPKAALREMTSEIGAIIQAEIDQAPTADRLPHLIQTTKDFASLVRALDTPPGKYRKAQDLRARIDALRLRSEAEAQLTT